jgi:hypothetical protein
VGWRAHIFTPATEDLHGDFYPATEAKLTCSKAVLGQLADLHSWSANNALGSLEMFILCDGRVYLCFLKNSLSWPVPATAYLVTAAKCYGRLCICVMHLGLAPAGV